MKINLLYDFNIDRIEPHSLGIKMKISNLTALHCSGQTAIERLPKSIEQSLAYAKASTIKMFLALFCNQYVWLGCDTANISIDEVNALIDSSNNPDVYNLKRKDIDNILYCLNLVKKIYTNHVSLIGFAGGYNTVVESAIDVDLTLIYQDVEEWKGTADFTVSTFDKFGCMINVSLIQYYDGFGVKDRSDELIQYLMSCSTTHYHRAGVHSHVICRGSTNYIQPNISDKVHSCYYTSQQIERKCDLIYEKVKLVGIKGSVCEIGEHCTDCSVRVQCPMWDVYQSQRTDVIDSTNIIGRFLEDNDSLSDYEMGLVMKQANTIKTVIAQIKGIIAKRISEGAKIEGWAIGNEKNIRQWDANIDHNVVDKLLKKFKVKVAQRSTIIPLTPAKALKIEGLSEEQIGELTNMIVTKKVTNIIEVERPTPEQIFSEI